MRMDQRGSTTPLTPRARRVLAIVIAVAGALYLVALPLLNAQEARLAADSPLPSTSLIDHGLGAPAWWISLAAVGIQAVLVGRMHQAPARTLTAISATAAATAVLVTSGTAALSWDAAHAMTAHAALLAVIPASYLAARYRRAEDSPMWWAAAAVFVWVARTASDLPDPEISTTLAVSVGAGQAALSIGLPALVGAFVRGRADTQAARERELIARADEHEARTEAALAAERTAIARELHDIAAHHLSGIAIMASAIAQQVDTDPAAAKASLTDVRVQTRTLLDELRGLVTLLRSDDGASVAVESLAGVDTLVDSARMRNQAVTLTLAPATDIATLAHGIGPLSQFAAYRTIQEALANAARHAPGAPCTITLTATPRALDITVTNAPAPPGHTSDAPPAQASAALTSSTGFGLRGMQERAALTKSRLSYGPTDDGGWHVTVTVPREETR